MKKRILFALVLGIGYAPAVLAGAIAKGQLSQRDYESGRPIFECNKRHSSSNKVVAAEPSRAGVAGGKTPKSVPAVENL